MPNPLPFLGLLGAAAVGSKPAKRRRKKNKSKSNGTSTQRKSSRALDIIRIQRGLPRTKDNDPSPQTVGEDAVDHASNGQARPTDAPTLRISKMIGSDTIGLTSDGRRGYVGAQWWARYGRDMLTQVRRRHPGATPEEALMLMLKQAAPSVEWDTPELPRGAMMLSRRLRRLVEASYMGREVEPRAVHVHPGQVSGDAQGHEDEEGHPDDGMPFAPPPDVLERSPAPPVPPGIEVAPEGAATAEEPQIEPEASESTRKETRRGGRRGGKKSRKEAAAPVAPQEDAHDTPEDGGGSADGGGASADPTSTSESEADPSSGQ